MKTYALKMAPTTSANAPMMLNGPARIRTFPGIASPIGTPVAGSSAYAALRLALNTRAAAIADPAASTVSTMGATSARARHVARPTASAVAMHMTSTTAKAIVSLGYRPRIAKA